VEELTRAAVASGRHLAEVASDAIEQDERLRNRIDLARWQSLFDLEAAAQPATRLALALLKELKNPEDTLA
jgi:3-carboxy-cis,cis-muconate cycloisomerase